MRKSRVLLIFMFLITAGLGGAAIFIGYRLSQKEEVTPEGTMAAEIGWCCCLDLENYQLCVDNGCYTTCGGELQCLTPKPNTACDRPGCGVCAKKNQGCYLFNEICDSGGVYDCNPSKPINCDEEDPPPCICSTGNPTYCWFAADSNECYDRGGAACPDLHCEYPEATYFNSGDCSCVPYYEQHGSGTCDGQAPSTGHCDSELPSCDADEDDCGTSANRTDNDPSCTEKGEPCIAYCTNCGNPSEVFRYCKPKSETYTCGQTGCTVGSACSDSTQCVDQDLDGTGQCCRDCGNGTYACNASDSCTCQVAEPPVVALECIGVDNPTPQVGDTVKVTTRYRITADPTLGAIDLTREWFGYQPSTCSENPGQAGCWGFEQNLSNYFGGIVNSEAATNFVAAADKNPNGVTTCSQTTTQSCPWSDTGHDINQSGTTGTISAPNYSDDVTLTKVDVTEDVVQGDTSEQVSYTIDWYLKIDGHAGESWKPYLMARGKGNGYTNIYQNGGDAQWDLGDDCTITVQSACDCESLIRNTADDTIAAGSQVPFTMSATCAVKYSAVTLSTTGTPALQLISRNPDSDSDPAAISHSIVYKVPDSASNGTEYCVNAQVNGESQVDACHDCFTVGGEEEPAFAAVKTSSMQCINDNSAARIVYTINVRNVSGVAGEIEYVEDTYDSRFESSWVGSFDPTPTSHNGNILRWSAGYTLQANDGHAGGNDEISFSYTVTVPAGEWGETQNGEFVPYVFTNHAVVKPADQDAIELTTQVEISCIQTGLFDKAITSGLLGLLLILLGALLFRFRGFTYKYLAPIDHAFDFAGIAASNVRTRVLDFATILSAKVSSLKARLHERTLSREERFEKRVVRKAEKKTKD